jgi:hypothetical protein
MPSIKCANCGHRILLPTPTPVCSNCGTPFTPFASGTSAKPVPTPTSMPAPLPPPTGYSPLPVPVPAPTPPIPVSPVAPTSPPVSAFGPLPTNMPSRPPDLEGAVAIPPTTHEVKVPSDWSEVFLGCIFFPILLVLRPMMFIMGAVGMSGRPERKMTITTIRVCRRDGNVRNARLEGDLMGAGISLSDEVSLWGSDRNGTLVVRRAYNHTTFDEIKIRASHVPWVPRIFATILLALILISLISFYSYR